MAKCIITFEDAEDDGEPTIDSNVVFEPALKNPLHGHKPTPAQEMGWSFFKAMSHQSFRGENESEDEDDD